MITQTLAERARRLADERQPFVTATVVRAQSPTSVRPGDVAIVLADGTIEGFVGGLCAEDAVRLHAQRALETGDALLLRLEPGAGGDEPVVDGAVTSRNPCLSGGAIEIFLEPSLPRPRVVVVGDAPVAQALRALAPHVGLEPAPAGADALAVVVASHGRDEEQALTAALLDGVPYVGLVASARRGEAVRASLDVPDALRSRLRTPAGLDIGARTAPEIALAILAEIVQERRSGAPRGTPVTAAAAAAACCHGDREH